MKGLEGLNREDLLDGSRKKNTRSCVENSQERCEPRLPMVLHQSKSSQYCITRIFRVEEIFAIFVNLDFAQIFLPRNKISTEHGISRNFPNANFSSMRK